MVPQTWWGRKGEIGEDFAPARAPAVPVEAADAPAREQDLGGPGAIRVSQLKPQERGLSRSTCGPNIGPGDESPDVGGALPRCPWHLEESRLRRGFRPGETALASTGSRRRTQQTGRIVFLLLLGCGRGGAASGGLSLKGGFGAAVICALTRLSCLLDPARGWKKASGGTAARIEAISCRGRNYPGHGPPCELRGPRDGWRREVVLC